MAKISVNIEAESTEDLKATIVALHDSYAVDVSEVAKAVTDPHVTKKPTEKPKFAAKKEKEVQDSTDSTSDTEPSKTGEAQELTKPEPEKSATPNQHSGAKKADVQALMKKAMADGHRASVKTAFQRSNATKLSELAEEDYGVFMTDLEALMETDGEG